MANDPHPTIAQTHGFYEGMERRLSSAAVLCETTDDRLLIIKAHYKKHWSLPSGIIDADETPLEAAVRETQEEVGIRLDAADLQFVAVVDRHSKEFGHTYQFVFRAHISADQVAAIHLQASEIDDYALVSRDEVLNEDRQTGRWLGKVIYMWARRQSGYREQTFSHSK